MYKVELVIIILLIYGVLWTKNYYMYYFKLAQNSVPCFSYEVSLH